VTFKVTRLLQAFNTIFRTAVQELVIFADIGRRVALAMTNMQDFSTERLNRVAIVVLRLT